MGEVEEAVSAADAAVIVVSGKAGVQVGTEKAWELCDKYNLPRMIYVTEMDVDDASFRQVVEDLTTRYGKKIAPHFQPIHEEIISLGMEENFIGGHPMAGSEKNGFANSKAHLIENAYYILTPSAKVSEEKINAYRNFVSSLKALPIVLDYRQHDCITGTISHLPHIIASTLVNFVLDTDTKEELMKALLKKKQSSGKH